ncbi:hypothetical protein LJ753_11835 [Arthrobacter sp. zg-Y20]|uniref:hypothetical protein n=1 Tax=unclassified Arthrobacter TaxID=235627 RepID=UPI001D145B2E|nr:MULTISPECIES: hypothetical protein [unclassified Arthrobacter]MCC3276559.1 hypothetical protein [Arthrobacter sp. zg-Y20]MDK1316719.1 hypothetical protein [Arthrobacter sp. zg.Y20]WIB06858.1 hypothetical protein QNO06_03765 [Arthrobacter sp. zg-Y20]
MKIHDAQGGRLGTVTLQGASVEFNLIPMSRLPDGEWPADAAVELLSEREKHVGVLTGVHRNLRASRFATRRPNMSLASLDEESVRRGLSALTILRESSESTPPVC